MNNNHAQVSSTNSSSDISLRDVAAPMFRQKNLILATFLAIFSVIILVAVLHGPSYSSQMAILVNRERLDPLVSTEQMTPMVSADNAVTQEEINSEAELLRSRDVLREVVLKNDLQKPQGFSFLNLVRPGQSEADRIERAVKRLAQGLKIEPIRDSNIIQVSYDSRSSGQAYEVLHSLADAYLAKHAAVHRPAGSYQFFATEAQKYDGELHTAEDALRSFEARHALADPDDQLTNLARQVAVSVGTLHQAEEEIASDEQRIREDRIEMAKVPQRSIGQQAAALNEKVVGDAAAALLIAETKRMQLAVKYDDNYPLVRESDEEIENDKKALEQAEQKTYIAQTTDRDPTFELLREDLARTEADLAAQRATRGAVQDSIHGIQTRMVGLDELALSQHDLQRDAKVAENNYLLYLGKREQERASNAMDLTRIANVAIAVPPAIPVLPVFSWPFVVLIALSVSAFLSLGIGYAADYFDSSFHTPTQVSNTLGIPIVIAMPKRVA